MTLDDLLKIVLVCLIGGGIAGVGIACVYGIGLIIMKVVDE